jgi:hypothetical protein
MVFNNVGYNHRISNCYFHHNSNYCLGNSLNVSASYQVTSCCFDNNFGFVYAFGASNNNFSNCIINNTSNVLFGSAYGGGWSLFQGNVFTNNSGSVASNINQSNSRFFNNAFYNNTNIDHTFGVNSGGITLTADPFVSAANGNFNLNDFPGGGNLLRAKYYELGGN